MAWTTPRTYSAGAVLTAAQLNETRDNLKLLWHTLSYTEFTSNVTVNTGTEGSAVQVVSAGAVTYEAKPIRITFYSPKVVTAATANAEVYLNLWDASTDLGRIAVVGLADGTYTAEAPVQVTRHLTPTAASHTYKVMAWRGAADGTVTAGAGGVGTFMPGYLLIEGAES